MSKSRPRKSFPDFSPTKTPSNPSSNPRTKRPHSSSVNEDVIDADTPSPGLFGFLREIGTRETVESILVALILALMFRAFLAEAFIIPTGSMAPSLMGKHKEITCENSGFQYTVGVTEPTRDGQGNIIGDLPATYCPITQHRNPIRRNEPDHQTNSGDRILVNKFIYDFREPERYDPIVFKYPNNAKQNYIKRLVGLPGENILIENGDIYVMNQAPDGSWTKEITKKPPSKLINTMQVVDDTFHIGKKLKDAGWPLRWQQYSGVPIWDSFEVGGNPQYESKGEGEGWLRYRHFRPTKQDWNAIELRQLPDRYQSELPAGQIISDTYSYNDVERFTNQGFHWVGDIGMEIEIEVKSTTGKLLLDVVEGGAHFVCEIDLSNGQATLSSDHPSVTFVDAAGAPVIPTADTGIKKPGKYRLLYFNADDRIHLWVNQRLVNFNHGDYLRNEVPLPQYSLADPADAEPLGVGVENAQVKINRLKIFRDLYYTHERGSVNPSVEKESDFSADKIFTIHHNPELWETSAGVELFSAKKGNTEPLFRLEKGATPSQDQFLPVGDNSPRSLDGRIWDGPNYVERELLIGRATFVYWPHTLNKPIPFFPNFKKMRFIK